MTGNTLICRWRSMRNNLIILESVIILISYSIFQLKSSRSWFQGTQTSTGIWNMVSGPKTTGFEFEP